MATKEEQVFDALKTELDKIKTAGDAGEIAIVYEQFEDIKDKARLPWIGIFPLSDTLQTGTTEGPSGKVVDGDFIIIVYIQEEVVTPKLYELLGRIKQEIEDDPQMGLSFVIFALVQEVNFLQTSRLLQEEGGARRGEMEIRVRVQHRHSRSDP